MNSDFLGFLEKIMLKTNQNCVNENLGSLLMDVFKEGCPCPQDAWITSGLKVNYVKLCKTMYFTIDKILCAIILSEIAACICIADVML